MAVSSVLNGIEKTSRLHKLLREYNSKFSQGYGFDKVFNVAGFLSGFAFVNFMIIFFLYRDNSEMTSEGVFTILVIFAILSFGVSYVFGNWWVARRLPKWVYELQKEVISCHQTITPDGALLLLEALKYAQKQDVHLKDFELDDALIFDRIVAIGQQEVNRRKLHFAVSVMVTEIEQLCVNAEEVARLASDDKCMDGVISSLKVASEQLAQYKK